MPDAPSHSPYFDGALTCWTLYVSHSESPVDKLVVFVHGFGGDSLKTWADFPLGSRVDSWWDGADLLFVGYRSTRESIKGTADRLCEYLPRFFPQPLDSAMGSGLERARSSPDTPYAKLFLVGHSLGGVVLRRALADCAAIHKGGGPRHVILDAELRLFSPADFGFRPAGPLAAIMETGSLYDLIASAKGRWSPAYRDLEPGSVVLNSIRRRTEALAGEYPALSASILWAEPDEVVVPERFDTDAVDYTVPGQTHRSVCKPKCGAYEAPWEFTQFGVIHGR